MAFFILLLIIVAIIVVIAQVQRSVRQFGIHAGRAARLTTDADLLREQGMPVLHTRGDLAAALGVSEKQLIWLLDIFRRGETPTISAHYVQFCIPKSGGGERTLLAPKPRLKAAQRWILREILQRVTPHEAAHGFRQGRSILTNALPHAGQEVVACFDLADFFPTITFPRVRGLFEALGYGQEVAGALAFLCTARMEPKAKRRVLPQGAPTSPAISNLIARRMDTRLAGLAQKLGFTYTRYADDCTMSGSPRHLGVLIRTVRCIVRTEHFRLNEKKLHIRRKGACQRVTGLVVNTAPTITRAERRRLRAILHQAKTTGLEAQNRSNHPHFLDYLRGKIAFLHMVHPEHAAPLARALEDARAAGPVPAGVLDVASPSVTEERGLDAYTPGPERMG